MNAIEIRDLTRKFGDTIAVDRLCLDLQQGELFALLGINGAGKTTIINMLCGLLRPTRGDARLLGKSIVHEAASIKGLINLSPQETAVAPNLSVRENLVFMAGIYGMRRDEARRAALEMIDRLDLSTVAGKRAATLSGGWQRRLSIAMALITRPKILFLDEPTLGLDVLARRELWQIIRGLRGKITLVLTTHYLEEAEALADRIGIMVSGRLTALGSAAELKAQTGKRNFEEAFIALATREEEALCD